ncbi:cytochrome b/b6 domain-containing protein, partial [Salmonella enterica]|uniref:cytochrome b/b6 domain-containing protein n=1 Tax=Salmonella sp. SAL03627 TaxID=3159765 RepID=UPI001C615D7F|nr:cytochrome b/b6 domain-containing protein [Salmonella enterica subsp. enterica serovar Weltevreden]
WFRNVPQVLAGKHEPQLQIGKYNAGQKVLFWGIMGLISLLLVSGVVIWRPYFAPLFSIPIIRIGLLVHALAGIGLILLVIGHAYLAFWVKGS